MSDRTAAASATDPPAMTRRQFAAWRERVGLSYRWAAHHLGVSRRTVINWECGNPQVGRQADHLPAEVAARCAELEARPQLEGRGTWHARLGRRR